MPKSLVDFKVTWKILTRLNHCFQSAHSQTTLSLFLSLFKREKVLSTSAVLWGHAVINTGPALADAGPNAKPKRGAPLSSDFMTSSCSVNRVTVVVEHKYAVQH